MNFWNHLSLKKFTGKSPAGQSESGQIILEYVLLLIVAVTIAVLITQQMISRDPGDPGFVIDTWNEIVNAIGADQADDIERAAE